ncbi:ATP-binding cassette domain-containing protein [Psychromarinibacter sp. C21-152]|uniref:ATP-binding cassette domain-containing protein n=1 Tax=Psychromarinibacter sediminicola TaxID=3033385 RepID=A0AAE3T6S9_9RHOB|nr:oligopeptide/dipeptide ABC transporter ATP-binding protein [Psychromarinibacter sediminicola]MDF0599630.1 ATP-binding cassette domain-containing protein [Psychromarinibacter sediminicola]
MSDAILKVRDLKKHFGGKKPLFGKAPRAVRAVDGIDFDLRRGETLGLVGESGCGKTTLGRCIVRAHDPTGGEVIYDDPDRGPVDLAALSRKELQPYRLEVQMIFQDPIGSLNPRMTLLEIIGEPMIVNGLATGAEVKKRVGDLLVRVGLRREHMNRYPHAFSGGQRQRIGIARALALNPKVIVCDEPVSALDVSVQAQILNLLQDLQRDGDLTFLFIAHDLGVVEYVCNRVAVMYVGRIVELAETDDLFARPLHPYSEALLSAVPVPDPEVEGHPHLLQGDVANAVNLPPGCHFHPRCVYCVARCRTEDPELREVNGRKVRCHRAEELDLEGVAQEEAVHG